jgi:prepilin-type N-terminal cleavage/methylation domain-containing protein
MCAIPHDNAARGGRAPQSPGEIHPVALEGASAISRKGGIFGAFARRRGGFSLLELMAGVAVLVVISGSVFSLLNYYQKVYGTTRMKADMYDNIRGVVELMSQEIGQAGLVSLPYPTLSAAVTANASPQAVAVSSTTSMFVGEKLLIDAGTNQEVVALTAVGASPPKITGIFGQNHAVGAPVNAQGVFPDGVMSTSTNTQLQLFGDINADGSLVFVQYDCNPGTTSAPGTLTRSVTTVTPTVASASAPQTLLNNLVANPGGTACFQYLPAPQTVGGYTFTPNVAVTLTVQTTAKGPQTGAYLTMTKTFLNLSPRNILIGLELANQGGLTQFLQPTPPNLPLTGG